MGDCTVRAICKALNADWEEMYAALSLYGFRLADMPSANQVWGAFLKEHGFKRQIVDEGGIYPAEYTRSYWNSYTKAL